MNRKRVAISISLPPDMAEEYDRLARDQAKNKSQLFRDMFLAYKERILEREFDQIQRYGAKRARRAGILTEDDVERVVFEGR